MIRDDSAYLKHILDSVRFINKYSKKMKIDDFIKDELVQSAMVRQLEIIGEAANLVSLKTNPELKTKEPQCLFNIFIRPFLRKDRQIWYKLRVKAC